ncbi:MAG TPA: MarC family protein, partial [Puia sp.]|nr:MarC family protein [Puia sp.]
MHFDLPFLHTIFIGYLSLFPVVNPIGSAFIVDPLLGELSYPERKRATKKIALYSLAICTVSAIVGSWVLKLFGISIPIVQVAGGFMICQIGWKLLTSDDQVKGDKESARPERRPADLDNILFYPVTFPMTTGAGTISVILTLRANEEERNILNHVLNLGALIFAIVLICITIYI